LRRETRSASGRDYALELRQLAKIEKKPHFESGGTEIIQDLSGMRNGDDAPGLHFHYHPVGDNQIGSILTDRLPVKPNLQRDFAFDSRSAGSQHDRETVA
jgi:hypothetical protein